MPTPWQQYQWPLQAPRWPLNRPKAEDGLARLTASKTTHGRTTKAERAKAKHRAKVSRQVMRAVKEIETWAVDHGHLAKDWRDQFK